MYHRGLTTRDVYMLNMHKSFENWKYHRRLVDLCNGNSVMAFEVFSRYNYTSILFMQKPLKELGNQTPVELIQDITGIYKFFKWLL